MRFAYRALWCYALWSALPLYCAKVTQKVRIGLGEPNAAIMTNANVEDKWFEQKLDHFNPTDVRTWNQRYRVNRDYYETNGPVFLLIEGESTMTSKWIHSGAWIEYAKEFNALCVQLEHRFYGPSHPTENRSTENLVYLSSEQALADVAEFIINVKRELEIPSATKWITFGGSYAGSLSAWIRMKYPHLVHAAVSSSGPLLAKIDFYEYFQVVENSLAAYKPECVSEIGRANKMLNGLLKIKHGPKIIEKKFKLCDSLDKRNEKDVANLFESLADNFAGIVQYNKNNRYYQNAERSSVTLETLCDIMLNKSIPTPLDRYAAVNSKLLSVENLNCLSHIYTQMIDDYSNISWNNETNDGGRQWMYQTCTEFGFYQTSSQDTHVFGHNFPIEFFIDMCTDIFGKSYNSELLSKAVERTNMMYGELNIRGSRVIYVHGSVDPWHALGITETRTKNTVSIYINGSAHCANMYPPSPNDSPQLTEARTTIKTYLSKWLTEDDIVDRT